jgi:hypothetical protein
MIARGEAEEVSKQDAFGNFHKHSSSQTMLPGPSTRNMKPLNLTSFVVLNPKHEALESDIICCAQPETCSP